MKVIIAGSRHMPDSLYNLIGEAIKFSGYDVTEIISGRARGADRLGEHYAKVNRIPLKAFPADWVKYGKAAGPIRNSEMKNYADAAIVFIWDNSRGSANMISQMQKAGKPVFIVKDGIIENL